MYIMFDRDYYNLKTVLAFLDRHKYRVKKLVTKDNFYIVTHQYKKCLRKNLKTVSDYHHEGIYYIINIPSKSE